MFMLTFFAFITLLSLTFCKDCELDNLSKERSFEYQLDKDLMCHYDAALPPPTNDSEPVRVDVDLFPRILKFSTNEEVFHVFGWVILTWKDDRLSWDPQKYGSIRKTETMSFHIWSPGLRLFNTAESIDGDFFYTSCQIRYTGKVMCYPKIRYEAFCSTDLRNWPYDTQYCTLRFGAWERTQTHTKVLFTFGERKSFIMLGHEYSMGWTVVSINRTEDINKTEQLSINFGLQRQSQLIGSIIVVPSIIAFLFTLSSLLLFINSDVRLGLLYFCLWLHYRILKNISYMLPKHSSNVPKILLFTRGSLVLACLSVILTFVLKILRKRKLPPPLFVSLSNNYVNRGFIKYLIWPKWEAEINVLTLSEEMERRTAEDWNDFTNIVNTAFIFVFIIVNLCLFALFMPILTPLE